MIHIQVSYSPRVREDRVNFRKLADHLCTVASCYNASVYCMSFSAQRLAYMDPGLNAIVEVSYVPGKKDGDGYIFEPCDELVADLKKVILKEWRRRAAVKLIPLSHESFPGDGFGPMRSTKSRK